MQCPICQESYLDSEALNEHLDAEHSAESPDFVSNFIHSTRKFFQSSKPIELKKFELNENPRDLTPSGLTDEDFARFLDLNSRTKGKGRVYNQSEFIRKNHWIDGKVCSVPDCGLQLGIVNGRQNCYKCGKPTCTLHSSYQMKLSGDARHDPVNGIWARVCEKCYISRYAYNDCNGVARNRTGAFLKLRGKNAATTLMEVNKIEKRLARLTDQALKQNNSIFNVGGLWSTDNLEVIPWMQDGERDNCCSCNKKFSAIKRRRHHCRLCGNLICGDCSRGVDLLKDIPNTTNQEIRACPQCVYLLSLYNSLTRRKYSVPLVETNLFVLYNNLSLVKSKVINQLESFNAIVTDLSNRPIIYNNDQDYQIAMKVRKEILDNFAELDHFAKTIANLRSSGRELKIVQDNIFTAVLQFVRKHMLTLQLMPTAKPKEEEPEIFRVLRDSIMQLNLQLNDALRLGRKEDASALTAQIEQLETELEQYAYNT